MKATIWGCRGSIAAPGPETVRYGGNTSCVELRLDDGTVIVLDAGTGIRALGRALMKQGVQTVHLLLSHLHLDHLQGLAFFEPLYDPRVELHIWGPPSPTRSLEERVAVYMSEPLFPVNLSDLPAKPVFHDAGEESWTIGSAVVWASPVSHQGPTVGYRITSGGRSLAYIPDHEPTLGVDLDRIEAAWLSGYALAEGVDVLLHDAQYSEDEYPSHLGWGHSGIHHVVGFARRCGVGQLVLFHHDPSHGDEFLDELHGRAIELWGDVGALPVMAFEGMTVGPDDAGRWRPALSPSEEWASAWTRRSDR